MKSENVEHCFHVTIDHHLASTGEAERGMEVKISTWRCHHCGEPFVPVRSAIEAIRTLSASEASEVKRG